MALNSEDFSALLASLNTEAGQDKFLESMRAASEVEKYVIALVKERKFTITGDDSHLSVRCIIDRAAKIDQPRKYDFQDEDVNEKDFLRSITGMLPDGFSGLRHTAEDLRNAIAGTTSVTFTARDQKCYDCAKPLRLTLCGTNLHLDCETACENNSTFSVEIDFPTGEVVFADWPFLFNELKNEGWLDDGDDDGSESINYIKGQRQRSDVFARQGIYHHSVGNSCPTFYYNETTSEIRIGGGSYDEETDETTNPEGFTDKGSFCTDLWWVTMLDRSRYDEMVSKLPEKPSRKEMKKALKDGIATIKPGRYRFTAVPMTSDEDEDYGRVYATAEYLGPCGEVPKVRHVSEGRIRLTPRQYVIRQVKRYAILYPGTFDEARFAVMDQTFNVLGNGIRNKGEFFQHISVPEGTEISDEFMGTERTPRNGIEDYIRAPYPNFRREYCLLRDMSITEIPTDWLEEMAWFYGECQQFFASDNAGHYHNAYPSLRKDTRNTVEEWQKIADRRQGEAKTPEEFQKSWVHDYGHEYHGDISDFLTRRWNADKVKIHEFITWILAEIHAELTKRTSSQ